MMSAPAAPGPLVPPSRTAPGREPGTPAGTAPPVPMALRLALNGILGLLGLQFLLGMYLNLVATSWAPGNVPVTLPHLFGPAAGGVPLLAVHATLGVLLVFLAVVVIYLLRGAGRRRALGGGVAGLLAILLAGLGGADFLDGGGPPLASYLMAVGFLAAFWAYFWVRVRLAMVGNG